MKYSKIFLPSLIALFTLTAFSQAPNTLKQKCPNVSVYSVVQITALGDINVQPCSGRTTTFTQNVVLPAGTVIAGGLFKANNGTAGAPSYSFVNSPTTGFYRSAADTIGVSTAGAENTLFSAAVNSQKSASFTWNNVAANAEFKATFTTGAAGLGSYVWGDNTGAARTYSQITNATGTIKEQGVVVQLGDSDGTANSTYIQVDDASRGIILAASGASVLNTTGINSWFWQKTVTAGGTVGAQTINKPAGTVNVAAANASIVITNNTVTTSSIPFVVLRTADATCTFVKSAVPTANTLTITLNAACGAETSVGFVILN